MAMLMNRRATVSRQRTAKMNTPGAKQLRPKRAESGWSPKCKKARTVKDFRVLSFSRMRLWQRRREGLLVLPIRRYGSPPPLCLWGEETEKGRLASATHTAEEEETCLPPQKQ
jgi:hypothetical protein